ncbi:MAG: AAA family ATPase [Candidatus Woesebacteria bacterium]|jgi:wobble nucleotide-excising tRNase
MKIKKINKITKYKSFTDFKWDAFCKNAKLDECVFGPFNLFFGENGSGKTTVCEILKDLVGVETIEEKHPEMVVLEAEEIEAKSNKSPDGKVHINKTKKQTVFTYQKQAWDKQTTENNPILFFDIDFVNKNIHTHGTRSNLKGQHSQNAGNLVINLDSEANVLKKQIAEKKEELKLFLEANKLALQSTFTQEERVLFENYKNKKQASLAKEIKSLKKQQKEIENKLATIRGLLKKIDFIKNIKQIDEISYNLDLLDEPGIKELFNRSIKQKAEVKTDKALETHFQKHKSFLEKDSNYQRILNPQEKDCPLCAQSLSGATKVINYYKQIFDKSYEEQKKKYIDDIDLFVEQLEKIKSTIAQLFTRRDEIFSNLEKLYQDFKIEGIYSLEEKQKYHKKDTQINSFADQTEQAKKYAQELKNIDIADKDKKKRYILNTLKGTSDLKLFADSLEELRKLKNTLIKNFQDKYKSEEKITGEIQSLESKNTDIIQKITFISDKKTDKIKEFDKVNSNKEALQSEIKVFEQELDNNLAKKIPASIIKEMDSILKNFQLAFSLKHIKPAPNTKEYPFSFEVIDKGNNKREFKKGLSEGERQIISIAFFFALNKKLESKDAKILVFDDPITSLDAPNLKILAELIHSQTKDFSQVFIFTHHPLFYKYLSKCISPDSNRFGVLKNREEFGGGFIFVDPGFDVLSEVKGCYKEISDEVSKGTLKMEALALKYGQLLRLAIERFIKNDLLMWNKEDKFEDVTNNLVTNRSKLSKLSDDDLKKLTSLYKYCNYSNLLHADKEIPSAISELDKHIQSFIKITDKVNIN